MWGFIVQPRLATVVVDFTNALSLLGVGLFSLLVLSAGLITRTAIHSALSQGSNPADQITPVPAEYQQAA